MFEEEMMKDIDTESRYRIVHDLDHNLFVEASAGSGKTTSLVNRMVALVEKGVPVDKICTITFTKAAADEFYARFQKLLSIRSVNIPDSSDKDLGNKTETSIKLCQKALADIDLCFLGTIDSFTNMVAHEMPNEIGIPTDAKVVNNEEREILIKKEYEKILSSFTHPLNKYALIVKDNIYPPYVAFAEGIKLLLNTRDVKVIYDEELVNTDESYFIKEKNDFLKMVESFLYLDISFGGDNPKAIDKRRTAYLKDIEKQYHQNKDKNVIDKVSAFKRFISLIENPPGKKLGIEVEGSKLENDGVYVLEKKSYVLSEEAHQILDAFKIKIDNYLHAVLFHLLSGSVKEISEELKKENKYDFNDFLYDVSFAFRKSAMTNRELVDHIYERHSYFLLDENQDTNPVQTRLFFYLTGTKISGDWSKVEPREGSLFIVGDPKQSIYCFRDADVRSYLKTKSLFEEKGELLLLTKNFRSNVRIKDWLNKAMDPLLNHGDKDNALSHQDIEIRIEERNSEIAGTLAEDDILLDGEYKYITGSKDEAENLANFIVNLVNDKKYKIISKNPDKSSSKLFIYRNISYKDFLIVPRGTAVQKYIQAFNNHHIPMVVEAGIPFNNSASLLVLSSLGELLKCPRDRYLFMKVVTSELYSFTDGDITNMLYEGFDFDISDISSLSVTTPRYIEVIKELNRLYIATKGMSFSSLLMYLLNDKELSLLTKVDPDFLEYTYFLIEKVREKEEQGELSGVNQFKEYLKSFMESSTDENRVLRFKENVDRVKIANLHKVKGLQAPIVMLINPLKKEEKGMKYVDNSLEPRTLNVACFTRRDNGIEKTIIETHRFSDSEKQKWTDYDKAERDRIEYVGATRPESVLIVAQAEKVATNEYDPWEGLSSRIGDDRYISINMEEKDNSPVIEEVNYISPSIDNRCNDISVKYHSPSDIVKDYKIAVKHDNEDVITDNKDRKEATLIGSMVHRLMECIISSKDGYSDNDLLIDDIVNEYDGEKYREILRKVLDVIYHGGFVQKNSSIDNDILKTLLSAEEVACEVPFSYKNKETVIYGIIDLLYKDDKGYHIIDYKTNKEDDVSILEKEYHSQLEDYKKALKANGIDADAHIYHIDVE